MLVGVLAMYAGLVFYRLAEYPPFWYDDVTVAQPPIDLLTQGYFPRVYTVPWYVHQFLMFLSLTIFGIGVVQIKLASVFMGFSLILVTYLIGKKLFSIQVAFIAILLLVVDPFFFQTARWGRPDMTAVALFMLALYFFVQAQERQSNLMFSLSAVALGVSVFSHENGLFLGIPIMFLLFVITFRQALFH